MTFRPKNAKSLLGQLVKNLTGGEPELGSNSFTLIEHGTFYLSGTTIRALGTRYEPRSSGLLVPSHLVAEHAPIDMTYKYIPWSEIFGEVLPLNSIISVIQQFRRDELIAACAGIAEMSHPSVRDGELDRLIERYFPTLIQDAKRFSEAGDRFFGPQAALVIAKLAILKGDANPNLPEMPFSTLVSLCMAIQDHFAPPDGPRNEEDIAVELVANYWLHRRLIPLTEFKRFEERWLDSDPVSTRLRESFLAAQGISAEVVARIAITLVAKPRVERSRFSLDTSSEDDMTDDISRSIELLSADAQTFKTLFPTTIEFPNFAWDFSGFQRYPIYRRGDGMFSTIDPSLLLRRCLGWPLVYDSLSTIPENERNHFHSDIERLIEKHTRDKFVASLGEAWSERVIHESEIQTLFGGKGIKTADLAVEYSNSWLIVEISAIRPRFQALAARSASDYRALLGQAITEAKQAISTCESLLHHADHPSTKFRPIARGSRMYPLVVLTEGFPINPFVLRDIRQSISQAGLGNDSRIGAVEIVGPDELEMLLALSTRFGLSIVNLLAEKASSNFRSDSVNNFLSSAYQSQIQSL